MPLHIFESLCTITHFGERFRDGQCSLVSFLFAHYAPRAKPFVKVGARPPVVPALLYDLNTRQRQSDIVVSIIVIIGLQGGPKKVSHYRESSLNYIKNRQPG